MKAQVAAPVTVNCFLLLAAVVVKPQKVLLAGNLLNFIVTKFFFMTEVRPMLPEHWEDVKKIYEEGIVTGNATFQTSAPSWEEWNNSHLPSCRYMEPKQFNEVRDLIAEKVKSLLREL